MTREYVHEWKHERYNKGWRVGEKREYVHEWKNERYNKGWRVGEKRVYVVWRVHTRKKPQRIQDAVDAVILPCSDDTLPTE